MASVSKDRTSIFDGQVFKLSEETGTALKNWLETGIDLKERKTQLAQLWQRYLAVCDNQSEHAKNAMKQITGKVNSAEFTKEDIAALFEDITRREDAKMNAEVNGEPVNDETVEVATVEAEQ